MPYCLIGGNFKGVVNSKASLRTYFSIGTNRNKEGKIFGLFRSFRSQSPRERTHILIIYWQLSSFKMEFILKQLITTSVEGQLQENKQIKVEVAEELKDTCWLDERISEGQIRSLKENQSWDVYQCSMAREEVGKYLTKIEFNLGDCGLFLILQPKLLTRVIEALK